MKATRPDRLMRATGGEAVHARLFRSTLDVLLAIPKQKF
jgi:hypothetical protein